MDELEIAGLKDRNVAQDPLAGKIFHHLFDDRRNQLSPVDPGLVYGKTIGQGEQNGALIEV